MMNLTTRFLRDESGAVDYGLIVASITIAMIVRALSLV